MALANLFQPGANLDSGMLSRFREGLANASMGSEGQGEGQNASPGNPLSPYFDSQVGGGTFVRPNPMGGFEVIPNAGMFGSNYQSMNGKPNYFYDRDGNFQRQGTASGFHNDSGMGEFLTAASFFLPAVGATIAGMGAASGAGAGAGTAAGGGATMADMAGVGTSVIPEGAAFAPATASEMATMGLGGGGLSSIFSNPLFRRAGGSVLGNIFGGGGSNGGKGMFDLGNINLGDIFNVGAGIYGSQQQGQAANKFMDFMNNNMNYVKNYGAEGSPEMEYLRKSLEARDAAAGRNSQYGPRSVELLAQLAQPKLEATSRMALGFANPYQKALGQDANKYAALPALFNRMGMGSTNLSSILNGLGSLGGSGGGDFIDMLNQSGGMPADIPYDPSTMPTEEDILPFLDDLGQYF